MRKISRRNFLQLAALSATAFALNGCAANAASSSSTTNSTSTTTPTSSSSIAEAASSSGSAVTSSEETAASDTLVAYFSCTGNTKNIADKIAVQENADLYAITPAQPYTSDDLNYNDNSCRANQEMDDASARPALGGEKLDLTGYDTLYLGYPIWWGTAPRIIQTFLESYNLEGKTVYLFCTSGSSGVDKSLNDLKKLYPKINFAAAHRFSGRATDQDVSAWLTTL